MQQIALCPQRNAAINGQRHHPVILIDQIDAIAVDDEIIHRTQFAFPHNLTTAQIKRRQVTIIGQRENNAVNNDGSRVNIAQTVNFGRTGRLGNTLLPNHLALFHQHCADATIITTHDGRTKSRCRRRLATQRERRHIEVNCPFDSAVSFVQRL
ncbi:hypothetical protein HmCmsJML030_01138 [Escherichia coli]|nr:hypothetical protein HmCmsJML030_01138 [Escherichia coli]